MAVAGQIVSYVIYIVLARRTHLSAFDDYVVAAILEFFRPEFVDDGVPVLGALTWPAAFSVLFSMAPIYLNWL